MRKTSLEKQEQARARDKQLRSVRQTDRSGLNFFAQANSTPVRNDNPRTDNQGVHFKTNPTRHVYSTTSDDNDLYEPPENDSIIQTASPLQMDEPMISTTKPINRNTTWRHNNNAGTTVGTHRTTSVTGTDNRSGPICFRCGGRGHLRFNCTERVLLWLLQNIQPQLTSLQKATRQHTQPNRQPDCDGISPHSNTTTLDKQSNHQTISFLQNLSENNQPRTSTMIQTPYAGASPTTPADLMEGLTQIVNQATKSNKTGWDRQTNDEEHKDLRW